MGPYTHRPLGVLKGYINLQGSQGWPLRDDVITLITVITLF